MTTDAIITEKNLIKRDEFADRGGQNLCLQSFWKVGEHKLLVEIKRNTYDFQSVAKISTWTDSGWKVVATIPYPRMASLKMNYLNPDVGNPKSALRQDEKALLDLAEAILL